MIRVLLDGITSRIDRVAVVDGVTLEVHPNELTYVLGPSGSGKTTLARLITGLETLDDGEIYFDGKAVQRVPVAERRVGLIFQADTLWPHWNVAENVGYGLKLRGVSRRERRKRVEEALVAARIDGLADRRPARLSALHRRRVAIARAIAIDPILLVFDEPLAGLEGRDRDELGDDLRRIQMETETTTLVLTADPREALKSADRVAVLDLGRIVQIGTPWEIYNRPADTFVAEFLGPTNLLQGQLETTDARGGAVVRTPIGRLVGMAPPVELPGGCAVTVSIRPESLSFGAAGTPLGVNRFAAMIERQTLLGSLRDVQLRGPGDWPMHALVLSAQSQDVREGQNVTVTVAPELVVVLPTRKAPS